METTDIKRNFLAIDKDGSGEISVYELGKIMHDAKTKMSQNGIAALITEFNFNRNGTQEKDICDFLNIMPNRKNTGLLHKSDILRTAIRNELRQFGGGGHINTTEFRNVLKRQKVKVSEAQFGEMIQDAEIDGEGKIQYDGFVLVMKKIERCISCFFYITVSCNS